MFASNKTVYALLHENWLTFNGNATKMEAFSEAREEFLIHLLCYVTLITLMLRDHFSVVEILLFVEGG